MQLGIAGCFRVETHRRCCGLRTLLSVLKPKLTYSFCYGAFFFMPSWDLFVSVRLLLLILS
jgi:hypothetical protein